MAEYQSNNKHNVWGGLQAIAYSISYEISLTHIPQCALMKEN